MINLISFLFLGFFLGMRHATDADHVIAVTTIVSRQRGMRSAALIGILWGLGHTFTLLLAGGALIVFSVVIPPRLGLTMELAVALMLVILGLLNLRGMRRWINESFGPNRKSANEMYHDHPHRHGDYVHSHVHGHEPEDHGHQEAETPPAWLDRSFGRLGVYQSLRPIFVGIVHGLAGSAALPLLALPIIEDQLWALIYLFVFGLGTITGMMLITTAIALPLVQMRNRSAKISRYLAITSGLLSLGFGLLLFYRIGFVHGLLLR